MHPASIATGRRPFGPRRWPAGSIPLERLLRAGTYARGASRLDERRPGAAAGEAIWCVEEALEGKVSDVRCSASRAFEELRRRLPASNSCTGSEKVNSNSVIFASKNRFRNTTF